MSPSVPAGSIPEGTVTGVGEYAVGNNGEYFAVGSQVPAPACRPRAGGSIDGDGCLVCPWHGSKYDVTNGQMVRAQASVAKIPPWA